MKSLNSTDQIMLMNKTALTNLQYIHVKVGTCFSIAILRMEPRDRKKHVLRHYEHHSIFQEFKATHAA